MRYASKGSSAIVKPDMTPMIDIVFQLIAFFMVLINFTEADTNQQIRLASSPLAVSRDEVHKSTITIQVTEWTSRRDEKVIVGATITDVVGLKKLIGRKATLLEDLGGRVSEAMVVIRGDKDSRTGTVQEIMEICREKGFQKFNLKAKEAVRDVSDRKDESS